MKVPFTLGEVGHFGLAVRDPQKSAQWFQRALGLRKEFDYENGVAVGNDNVTIALFKGTPSSRTRQGIGLRQVRNSGTIGNGSSRTGLPPWLTWKNTWS